MVQVHCGELSTNSIGPPVELRAPGDRCADLWGAPRFLGFATAAWFPEGNEATDLVRSTTQTKRAQNRNAERRRPGRGGYQGIMRPAADVHQIDGVRPLSGPISASNVAAGRTDLPHDNDISDRV